MTAVGGDQESPVLVPHVKGRERLYGWYPPGYNTFTVPTYKILSTKEDEILFNSNVHPVSISASGVETTPFPQPSPIATSTQTHQHVTTATDPPNVSFCVPAPTPAVNQSLSKPQISSSNGTAAAIDQSAQATSRAQQQQPCIRSSSIQAETGIPPANPKPGLRARLETIRQDLVRRQQEGMSIHGHNLPPRMITSAKLRSSANAVTGINDMIKPQTPSRPILSPSGFPFVTANPPGWTSHYPEPDLRSNSPAMTRPSSEASTASLNRSISLPTPPSHRAVPSEVDYPAPLTEDACRPVKPIPPSPNRCMSAAPTSRRPKTAPAHLRKSASARVHQIVYPATSESCGMETLCIQGQSLNRPPTAPNRTASKAKMTCRPMTAPMQSTLPATPLSQVDLSQEEGVPPAEEAIDERQLATYLLEDDYDRALNQYGWRMEVPGDPLKLKEPLLPSRLACTVKLAEPEVLPQAPSMQKQNRDTFFHSAMPRKVWSFDIAPDFSSERYNKIRDQKRKLGLWNYSAKSFSFVY